MMFDCQGSCISLSQYTSTTIWNAFHQRVTNQKSIIATKANVDLPKKL